MLKKFDVTFGFGQRKVRFCVKDSFNEKIQRKKKKKRKRKTTP